jgi:hypothetical protein
MSDPMFDGKIQWEESNEGIDHDVDAIGYHPMIDVGVKQNMSVILIKRESTVWDVVQGVAAYSGIAQLALPQAIVAGTAVVILVVLFGYDLKLVKDRNAKPIVKDIKERDGIKYFDVADVDKVAKEHPDCAKIFAWLKSRGNLIDSGDGKLILKDARIKNFRMLN